MSFVEILLFLLKRKRYSIGIPFLAGILGFVIAWLMPEYYKSEVKVFLDTGAKTASINSLLKGGISSDMLGSLGANMQGSENEQLYLEIIDGRDVNFAAIEKFRLDTIYKRAKYKETLLKQFYKDIKIEADELRGIISCSYEAKNKVLARDLVRFVVEEANARYIKLRRERALQTLEQLHSSKQRVIASADSLSKLVVSFYRDNNFMDLETQLKLTLTALASYEEQIKNMKISESMAGSDNSTVADLRKKRFVLEKEAQKLRGEFSKEYLPSKNSIYINSDWAVEKIIEKEKMESDLRRLFSILEVMERNIAMEEANAARDLPVIQIVQDAYLPDYKSKPKRAMWAVISSMFAFAFITCIMILRGMLSGEINCNSKIRENFDDILKAMGLS